MRCILAREADSPTSKTRGGLEIFGVVKDVLKTEVREGHVESPRDSATPIEDSVRATRKKNDSLFRRSLPWAPNAERNGDERR